MWECQGCGGVRDVGGVGVRDVGGGVRDVGGGGGDSWRLAASSETQLCDLLQQVFAVLHVVHWRGADAHSLQTALLLKKQQQNLGLLRTHSRQTSLFSQKQQQKLGLLRTQSQSCLHSQHSHIKGTKIMMQQCDVRRQTP